MKAGYHNIKNAGYIAEETVKSIAYAKSLKIDPQIGSATQYANGRLVAKITSDSGFDGEIGVTAQDEELEKAVGRTVTLTNGSKAIVGGANPKRLKGLYYEFEEEAESGTRSTVKVWLHNVEIGASSFNHSTDSDKVDFGDYSYPITVYGDPLMSSDSEKYVDDHGVGRTCFMSISRPGDTGYLEFGSSIPSLVIATESE